MSRYTVEILPNGYYRVFDRRCKWAGLYHMDYTYPCGALHLSFFDAVKIITANR